MKSSTAAMPSLVVALALAFIPLPAVAGSPFDVTISNADWGKSVAVRYHHGLFGWIDAGRVEFHHDGRTVIAPRGGQPRETDNLAESLAHYAADRLGNPALGRQLAQVIEREVGK